ncbi:MAG TPA: NAD(P)/FAD-dependent oxidoreductase [Solirubrobacteraceae bacterium]|jgi:NADH dehydrogenase|nr:NAD(P)/FAD-dependent oxidoreductase [Solirubrobacteraceae bacterium]
MSGSEGRHVVIIGGGFAGLGCAQQLAKHDDVHVTLIDRNNYHQFQPLLYQVATSQLAPSDIAHSLRSVFADQKNVDVKLAEISALDPATRTVTSTDGERWEADVLVLAAGSQPNFFGTPGASESSFPLYSLDDATRLRSRILGIFEQVDRDPKLVERGALNFVIVGGGPTGVEVAGAIADMLSVTVPAVYQDLDAGSAQIHLLDYGDALLKPFSDKAHGYVAKVLEEKGVKAHLGTGVKEVGTGHALLSDGNTIATRCVIWGGGIMAAAVAADGGLAQGRGGRVDVESDLTIADHPGVYVIGDIANIPEAGAGTLPQLGSVALQSGQWAADNILADFEGKPRKPFNYHDKGIMAMIGRGAAIAEVGKRHHEIHGQLAHLAWLGVHASLMTGTKSKIEAFVDWAWDGFSKTGGPHVLDRGDAAEIDWELDVVVSQPARS